MTLPFRLQATPENGVHEYRAKDRHKKLSTDDSSQHSDRLYINESGMLMLPENHPEYLNLIRLQLENQELNKWKCLLQNRITSERSEIIQLKGMMNSLLNSQQQQQSANQNSEQPPVVAATATGDDGDNNNERLIAHYLKENTLLEQKKNILAKEIFEESKELIHLHVELAIKKYQH